MSLTEVDQKIGVSQIIHPSITIRARSPHPPEIASPNADDACDASSKPIELAEMGCSTEATSKDRDSRTEVVGPTVKDASFKANLQFISLCATLFSAGWNDGANGPLLPRIQGFYHVGFAVVSLIFVFKSVCWIIGAFSNLVLTDKFGLGTVVVIGSIAQVIGYALQAPAPPFPVFALGYALNGFGMAIQDAGANSYVVSLKKNAATKMGILHSFYGVGAMTAPLIATQFAQIERWSLNYLTSLGIALFNTVLLMAAFRFKTQDECLAEIGQAPQDMGLANSEDSKYRQIFRMKIVHLLAVFALLYVGTEVTIGGWTVTYVINERGGGHSAGYISTGFFAGLTLGRVGLLWMNKKIGEHRVIYVYIFLAIGLELIVWLVPSLIGGAVAVCFVGMLLGPIFPIVMNHSARILPHWLLTGAIGWISGIGQAGSALVPFITGALASSKGISSLQPLMVATMGSMIALWMLVPNAPRRID